jgi:hypothetical protein
VTYAQLSLQFQQSDAPGLTYSERANVLQFIQAMAEANQALRAENRRLLEERNALLAERAELRRLLMGCWFQFAYGRKDGGYHDGGLSALEDVRAALCQAGLIDEAGKAVTR